MSLTELHSKSYGTCCCQKTTQRKWHDSETDRVVTACCVECAEQRVKNIKDCQEAWREE